MATRLLRSAVAGLAVRRSASLRLPARTPLSPVSAVSFSSNSAGARVEKHRIDENNDESLAARRRRKQERQDISRSQAGDYGYSYWVMDGLWDYARSSRGQDSTTNSSSSSISTPRESDVSSPLSEDLKGSSWSWGSGDSSYSGGGDFFLED
uniref:Uncharacterized protein n=1 Tax=Hordeum vulgare subsp. vulgare TaxID=112509 RepID=A0A8I6WNV1_HORVV